LLALAALMIILILIGGAMGSFTWKKSGLCIAAVVVVLSGILLAYGGSGGEFPRLVRRGVIRLYRVPRQQVPMLPQVRSGGGALTGAAQWALWAR
jgi:hypothetical protein